MGLVGGIVAAARPAQAGLFGGIAEDVYVNDTVRFFLSFFLSSSHLRRPDADAHTNTLSISLFLNVYSTGRRRSLGC